MASPGPEPLLSEAHEGSRFVLFPIRYPRAWEFYKRAQASFWKAEELDLARDASDMDRISEDERHFVLHVLAFFAASDGIVGENLAANFADEVKAPEFRAFYTFQLAMETVHSESYSLMIQTLERDPATRDRLFRAVQEIPTIGAKARWALRWFDRSRATFAERVVAFAVVEGVFFSGAFCSIYWLKKRGLFPGVCFANELISRDEGLHADFACYLHSELRDRCPPERVHEIVRAGVEIEEDFVRSALPVRLIGMNADDMVSYIRFVADRLCVELGAPKLYGARNPFPWMDMINMEGKTNFFERRVGEYAMAGIDPKNTSGADGVAAKHVFTTDVDF